MDMKVNIPYEIDEKILKVPLQIDVNRQIDINNNWVLQLSGEVIEYLNKWINSAVYDNTPKKFSNYDDLMAYLTQMLKDIKAAWKKYNKEWKQLTDAYNGIKTLLSCVDWYAVKTCNE